MGCETFGRVSCIAVTKIEPQEHDVIATLLAQHFVDIYGAPSIEAARGTALDEIDQMADLCVDHAPNTLLTITRELTPRWRPREFPHDRSTTGRHHAVCRPRPIWMMNHIVTD